MKQLYHIPTKRSAIVHTLHVFCHFLHLFQEMLRCISYGHCMCPKPHIDITFHRLLIPSADRHPAAILHQKGIPLYCPYCRKIYDIARMAANKFFRKEHL